jgi:DNA polymerase-3 subunit alpha
MEDILAGKPMRIYGLPGAGYADRKPPCQLQPWPRENVLRRAMGKKDKEDVSSKRKFPREREQIKILDASMGCSDKIEKSASYGFNKSHAAAISSIERYVTAFLKANYPGEWMAALMTSDSDDTTKVAKNIREAKSIGIPIFHLTLMNL